MLDSYAPEVSIGLSAGLMSVPAALNLKVARPETHKTQATTEGLMSQAFGEACAQLKAARPEDTVKRSPKLFAHF